jgi:hypothetical protein
VRKKTIECSICAFAFLLCSFAYAGTAHGQSLEDCEFAETTCVNQCGSGSQGESCRNSCYRQLDLCLSGVFPDEQAADPEGFCENAQSQLNQCWVDYQNCGGFYTDGCWEHYYYECRAESGIDYCQ